MFAILSKKEKAKAALKAAMPENTTLCGSSALDAQFLGELLLALAELKPSFLAPSTDSEERQLNSGESQYHLKLKAAGRTALISLSFVENRSLVSLRNEKAKPIKAVGMFAHDLTTQTQTNI